MKILIADDDRVSRALVKRTAGHLAPVIEADNGLDALALIQREDPDILITDLRMPIIDGFELISMLRASPLYRLLPIICLSGVSDRDEIAQLAGLGITDYVLKPTNPVDLTERLTRIVRQQANWKADRPTTTAGSSRPSVLLIDHDAAGRERVRDALATWFDAIEAEDGANGLRAFRAQAVKPRAVLVAEGLPLLSEDRLRELLHRLVPEPQRAGLRVLLLADSDVVPAQKAAHFDGVMARALDPAAMATALGIPESALQPAEALAA